LLSPAPIRSRAAEEGSFQIPLWGIPFALFLLYVCLFSGLGALGLMGPDEPRYAAIARAMAETHDWITPRLWGAPWFEKPILYYWIAGIAMRIYGVGEFAARLPSALAALVAVAAVKWTALRSYGVSAAWYSLLILPTCVAMIGFSRAASPDMLFAGLLTAAMAVASEMLQTAHPGSLLRIAFGFSLGAAVLAKGPAAIILAGGATLLWAALSRQWRAPFRFLHPLIIAVFCLTTLPWYVLCAMRNPDFLHVFIWRHNFERYLTPVFEHRQPFWFYGPILVLALLPWILFWMAALFDGIKRLKRASFYDSPALFFISWSAFPVLFFSVSQSKLPGYILPAIPPIAILVGSWISQSMLESTRTVRRVLVGTGAAFMIVAIPSLTATIAALRGMHRPEYAIAGGVAFVFGLTVVIFSFRRQVTAALVTLVLLIASGITVANTAVLPKLDSRISARQVASRLREVDPSVRNVFTYQLSRNWQYGLNFYLNRELPEWIPGPGQPEWILSSLPDPQFLNDYELQIEQSSRPVHSPALFLFHHK
jgi:4-amino-4-deoxy-L-arabinose transferase-like glycosyltransferase